METTLPKVSIVKSLVQHKQRMRENRCGIRYQALNFFVIEQVLVKLPLPLIIEIKNSLQVLVYLKEVRFVFDDDQADPVSVILEIDMFSDTDQNRIFPNAGTLRKMVRCRKIQMLSQKLHFVFHVEFRP